jgi:hypothetical protein
LPATLLIGKRDVQKTAVQDSRWGSFVFFSDPEGNRWLVQAIPGRA